MKAQWIISWLYMLPFVHLSMLQLEKHVCNFDVHASNCGWSLLGGILRSTPLAARRSAIMNPLSIAAGELDSEVDSGQEVGVGDDGSKRGGVRE